MTECSKNTLTGLVIVDTVIVNLFYLELSKNLRVLV